MIPSAASRLTPAGCVFRLNQLLTFPGERKNKQEWSRVSCASGPPCSSWTRPVTERYVEARFDLPICAQPLLLELT